jgi:ADP-heptose:LPS heptosyltransferase
MKTLHLSHPGRYCAGLGDCITWAWLANGPVPLQFWAEGKNREMLDLLGCRMTDSPQDALDPHDAYNRELHERCQRPRAEIWAEYLGIPCEPKRPTLRLPDHEFMRRRVALCPHTHFHVREYPPAYWMDLNWSLRARNVDVVWIMEHDDKQYVNRGPSMAYFGFPLRDVAAMLGSCAVVVANDSMPAHLAGTLGRPTIALMGPTHWNVFAHISNVHPMHSEISKCAGCHFGKPFRAACDMMCQAMMTLLPQDVVTTVSFILETLDDPRRISPGVSTNETAGAGNQRRRA